MDIYVIKGKYEDSEKSQKTNATLTIQKHHL